MTTYEDAVRKWGVTKLSSDFGLNGKFDEASVTVYFGVDAGWSCCGGSDPGCYCSMAESPSMNAEISYKDAKGKSRMREISYIDFADTLREILEAP
jgi:hypothetical protein